MESNERRRSYSKYRKCKEICLNYNDQIVPAEQAQGDSGKEKLRDDNRAKP